jgi:hypothetical protein
VNLTKEGRMTALIRISNGFLHSIMIPDQAYGDCAPHVVTHVATVGLVEVTLKACTNPLQTFIALQI